MNPRGKGMGESAEELFVRGEGKGDDEGGEEIKCVLEEEIELSELWRIEGP